ncbi:hypothetical protein [Mesorhizobium sp. LjRoot246]|uniref:hypothetical protein n=1 Tax=Mesorhizobium sp. LjRoot246 TaxID=3342294 RepID=UPI003ECD7A1F
MELKVGVSTGAAWRKVPGMEIGTSEAEPSPARRLTKHQMKNPPVRRVTGANKHHR